MSGDRSNWEQRLEALDEQLAAFGVRAEPAGALQGATERDVDADNGVVGEPDVAAADAPAPVRPARATKLGPAAGGVATLLDDEPRSDGATPSDATSAGGADATTTGDDATDDTDDADDNSRRRRAVLDWVVVLGAALLIAVLMRTFVLAHFVVEGESMESTLQSGDRVFVNKLSYRLHDPNRGDVVVLHQLNDALSRDLIKRVIALPGEVVEVTSCQVIVDGRRMAEPYLDPEALQPGSCGRDQAPLEIPADHVFVLGDNRGSSMDSRDLGAIEEDDLVGRAFVVFWPRGEWKWL